jgi:hypothetical protein
VRLQSGWHCVGLNTEPDVQPCLAPQHLSAPFIDSISYCSIQYIKTRAFALVIRWDAPGPPPPRVIEDLPAFLGAVYLVLDRKSPQILESAPDPNRTRDL